MVFVRESTTKGDRMATKSCGYCETVTERWNLAPIAKLPNGNDYIYDDEIVVCDDCYDGHCTNYNIQPLD